MCGAVLGEVGEEKETSVYSVLYRTLLQEIVQNALRHRPAREAPPSIVMALLLCDAHRQGESDTFAFNAH